MSIWDWAQAAYGRPGVAEACLTLQDLYGQQTCLLLWAVWAGETDPGRLSRAARAVRAWDESAIQPIRQARRALKAEYPPIEDGAREALREAVKGCELFAERAVLEGLANLVGRRPGTADPLEALEAASNAWGSPAPRPALADLAAALG